MPPHEDHRTQRFCIDLFAGAGGLSLGLKNAGFACVLAVEKSDMAAETYFRNLLVPEVRIADAWAAHFGQSGHPVEQLKAQIGAGLAVSATADVLRQLDAVERRVASVTGEVDLIAGGPPCQGFSLAGLRNPDDRRNTLPYEFLEFVRRLRPKAVLIENVTGIGLAFNRNGQGRAVMPELVEALNENGYRAQVWRLNARHFGVAQNRPRIMIAAIQKRLLYGAGRDPDALAPEWASGRQTALALVPDLLEPAGEESHAEVTAAEVLGDLSSSGYLLEMGQYPEQLAPAARLRNGVERDAPPNHTTRHHGPLTTARFALALYLAEHGLPENLFFLASQSAGRERVASILDQARLSGRVTDKRLTEVLQAAGLDPSNGLVSLVLALKTRKHSQRPLSPSEPGPTMMSLPDDHIHYAEPRTLTVREMARIQSFPDTFEFFGKETTGADRRRFEVPQYTQVGNAVPPLMAECVARHLRRVLDDLEEANRTAFGQWRHEPASSPAG